MTAWQPLFLTSGVIDPSSIVERFSEIFIGRTDAYGDIGGGCKRAIVSSDNYRWHLSGRVSTGIYPLRDDGTVSWAAIDLDFKEVGDETLRYEKALSKAQNIRSILVDTGLPICSIWCERSKSKGVHVWLFFEEPILAYDPRRLLQYATREAAIPRTEIFPKQDRLTHIGQSVGNYVNLPYFGALKPEFNGFSDTGRRVMVNWESGEPIPLVQFLSEACLCPASQVATALLQIPATEKSTRNIALRPLGSPAGGTSESLPPTPCFRTMRDQPARDGTRNNILTALAMHENRQGHPADFIIRDLQSWNRDLNDPALDPDEVARTVTGILERGYQALWCEHPVVQEHCVGERCRVWQRAEAARRADAPNTREAQPQIGGPDTRLDLRELVQTSQDPALWRITINGTTLHGLTTDQLLYFAKFRHLCVDTLLQPVELPRQKGRSHQETWETIINPLIEAAQREVAPEVTTNLGEIVEFIRSWLTSPLHGDADLDDRSVIHSDRWFIEEIAPDERYYFFKFASLRKYINSRRVGTPISGASLWDILHREGADQHEMWIENKIQKRKKTERVVRFPVSSIPSGEPIDVAPSPSERPKLTLLA